MKRMFAVAASVLAFATSGAAMHAFSKDFVIVTHGQGPDSTNLDQAVAAAGGTLTGRQPDIGVAFASSSNPGFAVAIDADYRVQSVSLDVPVQWIDISAVPANVTVQSAAERELFAVLQWNMKAIRADVAHNAGSFGCEVKRARVAVLDQGVYPTHVD